MLGNNEKNVPVIMALHHAVVRGKEMERLTGFNTIARKEGFIAVYPDSWEEKLPGNQIPRRVWNDGRGWSHQHGKVNDVQFLKQLRSLLISHYRINERIVDPNRVFLTGIASGASMVHRMACSTKDIFKGFASVSSTLATSISKDCNSSKSTNVLMIAGTADEFNHWCKNDSWIDREVQRRAGDLEDHCDWMTVGESGSSPKEGDVLSIIGTRNFWAYKNSCQLQYRAFHLPDLVRRDKTRVKSVSYKGCSKGKFQFYGVQGGGHQWAGRKSIFGTGKNNYDINAIRVAWRFFKNL